MNYAPQPWLADWSALTNEIVKANEEGEDDMRGSYERKERTVICQRCGAEFTAKSEKAKWCPPCNTRVHIERSNRIRAARKAAAAVTSIEPVGRTNAMSAADVPDVPADDYYSIEDKIKKTAPIETHFGPYKPTEEKGDTTMDMRKFPSLSNMKEHPEYFTGDDMVKPTGTAPSDTFTHVGISTASAPDRKRRLMDLYGNLNAYCESFGVAASDVLDRLRKIDEALS